MLCASMVTSLLGVATAQQVGYIHGEQHPGITLKQCTLADGCLVEQQEVTLDAQWRWLHDGQDNNYHSCYKGDTWEPLHCLDPEKCAKECQMEGVSLEDYDKTYGVTGIPGGLRLSYVSAGSFGSRLYVLDGGSQYKMWKLKNREFTFDVDVSSLTCGLNGALYFVEMHADGGLGQGNNKVGANFGSGYCDAQCPHDLKFIEGEANVLNWHVEKVGPVGKYGYCCAELDIWEANRESTAYTAHPCSIDGQEKCFGERCGDTPELCDCCEQDLCSCCMRYRGVCDKDGCDFNPFRMGGETFYGFGPEFGVDTTKPITVVTQFLTTDGTDEGDLSEIRRLYVQDGKVINNSISSVTPHRADSIKDNYCEDQKVKFNNTDHFKKNGGLKRMGQAMDRGLVLVLSLWDDKVSYMDWLDAAVGDGKLDISQPGVLRGRCPQDSGDPKVLRKTRANAYVTYGNISYGEISSTFGPNAQRIIYPALASLPILLIATAGFPFATILFLWVAVCRREHILRCSGNSSGRSLPDSEDGKPLVIKQNDAKECQSDRRKNGIRWLGKRFWSRQGATKGHRTLGCCRPSGDDS